MGLGPKPLCLLLLLDILQAEKSLLCCTRATTFKVLFVLLPFVSETENSTVKKNPLLNQITENNLC